MVFGLKNIFKIQKEETNPNKINNKNKGDQTNKIHVIQTSIKSSTRSKNGKNSKTKKSLEDVDLQKLKKIPKIYPLIKRTLEFSVLSRGNQVEKRLDFSPFTMIGSEIISLLSNLSWKCSSRQNELGHQLVELERVCTARKDESLVFLNAFEKSQQHARFQLFQLRIEIGNLGKLINNTIDRNKEIVSLVPNSLNIVKETKKFKRTIFALESKKKHNLHTPTTELKQQEQFGEKEKEKNFSQEQIWKSFIERRRVMQIQTISHEIIPTAVENSIRNITKKWVIKQKKRKERKLRELQQQQQQQQQQNHKSQQNSQQKKRKKQPKQDEKKSRTRKKKANNITKKANLVKSKEKKKNLNSKNKSVITKEKNNSQTKKNNSQTKEKNQPQTKKKSQKTPKQRKTHNQKPKQKPDEKISKEEQLRIENEKMKREIELLKKMQERSVNKK
ncbi:hypothetical protein M0813_11675 [Anaeramoeba flamelloides]|uniref:Uncharacterized protein n=1 Tax=Anaeramoeba flamelloides TaxID=1746091 RepID=A0ABQ8ZE51_9EUKA|nr:hypothetical protein M0813_11675 [Anaeramoeba flamelloides]